MSIETLATIWAGLLALLLAGYAILDGFDLGVGILHPFLPKGDRERRVLMNAIGPLWDGNEVWLVTFGGALFAAFPEAYATVFSGFYTAFMALLFALILRAVSLEFRGKISSPGWRGLWDGCFFFGSFLATFLFGVAVGNAVRGIPLDARGEFVGTLAGQLHPFALLIGALAVATFALHGTIFLYLKTGEALQARVRRAFPWTFGAYALLLLAATGATWWLVPRAVDNFERHPWLWILPVLNVLAMANIPRAMHLGRPVYAFVSSSATIAALVALFAAALFPNLVTSAPNPEHSLTVLNAASSAKTLGIMLTIAALGMPFVLGYTAIVYWTFRGKVELDEHGY